jgi:hypothetical protein
MAQYLGFEDDELVAVKPTITAPSPEVDVAAAAVECKKYLDSKKFDLIDYSLVNIECYPPSDSEEYPVLNKFASDWNAAFDYAESVTVDDQGTGFPEEIIEAFEAKTKEIAATVNSDADFWTTLRSIVLPLYDKSKFYDEWKRRWQKVEIFFDPIGLEATTTEIFTNKETGERIRGDVVRSTQYNSGFVIRIDGKRDDPTPAPDDPNEVHEDGKFPPYDEVILGGDSL